MRFLFVVFTISLFFGSNAQDQAVESADSLSISALLSQSLKMIRNEPLTTMQMATEGLVMAREIRNPNLEAEALKIIGNVHYLLSNYSEAASNFFDALHIYELLEDKASQAGMMSNIGLIYKETQAYEKAIETYDQGLKLLEGLDEKNIKARLLNNKGVIYNRQKMFSLAIEHYQASLKLKEQVGDRRGLANSYTNLANVAIEMENYKEALRLNRLSLKLEMEMNSGEGMAMNYNNIGEAYLKLGKFDSAIFFASKGLEIGEKLGTKIQIVESSRILADAFKQKGNYKRAFDHLKKYAAMGDSISNEDEARKLGRLESKLDLIKKEAQINELSQENQRHQEAIERQKFQRNAFLAITVIVLIASLIIIFTQIQKSKLIKKLHNEEVYHLRAEIKQLTGKYEGKLDLKFDELNERLVNPLSEREYEVLQRVFSQKSNQEIADELFVSINTIKTHLRNLYSKLGVTNRKAALDLLSKN